MRVLVRYYNLSASTPPYVMVLVSDLTSLASLDLWLARCDCDLLRLWPRVLFCPGMAGPTPLRTDRLWEKGGGEERDETRRGETRGAR